MNRYDHDAECPKCGAARAAERWDEATNLMKRLCGRCYFAWDEKPLDAPEMPAVGGPYR